MSELLWILAGAAVGIITGLLPGIHVNTLAAIAFAITPHGGEVGALLLLSVGTVHTVVNIIPGTYMGVPEDDGLSMLPAHQMLMSGRGREAVRISVAASMGGLLVATAGAVAYGPLLRASMDFLDAAAPWLVVAALAIIWFLDAKWDGRRWWRVLLVAAAAGWLGWTALSVPFHPFMPLAASGLLPLLSGLFGAAGLSFAMGNARPIPTQSPPRAKRHPLPVVAGSLIAAITAVLPGVTSAVAASFVPGVRHRPGAAVAALSAVNTAHATFAILVWMQLGRIRTGLADAADRWTDAAWVASLPGPGAARILAAMLIAATIGVSATLLMDRWASKHVDVWPTHRIAAAALAFLSLAVILLSGWHGAVLYMAAWLVGRLPLHLGVRRVHLVAALGAPIVMHAL